MCSFFPFYCKCSLLLPLTSLSPVVAWAFVPSNVLSNLTFSSSFLMPKLSPGQHFNYKSLFKGSKTAEEIIHIDMKSLFQGERLPHFLHRVCKRIILNIWSISVHCLSHRIYELQSFIQFCGCTVQSL